jgi:hypothetical protein
MPMATHAARHPIVPIRYCASDGITNSLAPTPIIARPRARPRRRSNQFVSTL